MFWRNHPVSKFKQIRWSGAADKYYGSFTVHKGEVKEVGVVVRFSFDDDGQPESYARLHFGAWTVVFRVPNVIKPHSAWVDTSKYEWSKGPDSGYWEHHAREYGLNFGTHEMHWRFGIQVSFWPNKSSGVWFYPWEDRKLISHNSIDLDGKEHPFDEESKIVAHFLVTDYDGEQIEATCHLERRRYRIGKGIWHWLRLKKTEVFTKLGVQFSGEVGPRKGSWKGGMIASSSIAEPTDTHASAMRKFCETNNLKLIGVRGVVS